MTLSTDQSTTVDNAHGTQLRRELQALRAENRALRRRVRALRASRDFWKAEAVAWKWGALHLRRAGD